MRRFDYTFLINYMLPADFLNMAEVISEQKIMSEIRYDKNKDIYVKLESIAKIQSVKGSNAIENIITTDKRIDDIVNNNSAPLNHSEMEIAGYRDALAVIHNNYKTLDIRVSDILKLHGVLLSYANGEDRGQFKSEDNVIMETDAFGNRKVRFSPTSAEDTPKAMEQLAFAYADAKNNSNINKLLLIPCVILDFLCIHPFSDGNGRMSRLLSLLLMYKNDFDVGKYISVEEQINKSKGQYYEALKQSSYGWENNENDYIPFIKNFITALFVCYEDLNKRFAVVNSKTITKKARIEATVTNSIIPISKSEVLSILPDVSPTTVEAVLADMLKRDEIIKIGEYKSAKYLKK